jgi:hypothetical protein
MYRNSVNERWHAHRRFTGRMNQKTSMIPDRRKEWKAHPGGMAQRIISAPALPLDTVIRHLSTRNKQIHILRGRYALYVQ